MFILVLMIGFCYQRCQKDGIEFEEMGQATLATTIGYGIVFTVAWLMFSRGITPDGVYASERLEPGIILKLASFGGNVSQRMRGFCIDPNSVITTLIPGAAYALANIVYRKQEIVKSILALAVYLAVVVYSGSRMALMCTFVMLTIFFIIGYKRANNKRQVLVVGMAILGVILIGLIFNIDAVILEVAKMWESIFGERASLGSEYGRLTIWKTNVQSVEVALLDREIWQALTNAEPDVDALVAKILHRAEMEYKFCTAGDADPVTLQIQKACAEYKPTEEFPETFYKEVISKVILYRDTHIEFKLQNGQIV